MFSSQSDQKRAELRRLHQVRLVKPPEEGTAAADLPRGVYGFTGSPGLAAPLFATPRYRNFEVHHASDGRIAIIGFVSAADADRLKTAHKSFALTLLPDEQSDATTIVAVGYDRIAQHRQYSIRNAPGLTLQVTPGIEALQT